VWGGGGGGGGGGVGGCGGFGGGGGGGCCCVFWGVGFLLAKVGTSFYVKIFSSNVTCDLPLLLPAVDVELKGISRTLKWYKRTRSTIGTGWNCSK